MPCVSTTSNTFRWLSNRLTNWRNTACRNPLLVPSTNSSSQPRAGLSHIMMNSIPPNFLTLRNKCVCILVFTTLLLKKKFLKGAII